MTSFGWIFLSVSAILLLTLPRSLAPLSFVFGVCYMTYGQTIELGPFSFTVIRILIAVGIIRILLRNERIAGEINQLDWLMVIWAIWAVISSFSREDTSAAFIFRLGIIYNTCGIYFLIRIFCQSMEDIWKLNFITALLLFPIAFEMIYEHVQYHNLFSIFGGVPQSPTIREGSIRAQGPFRHAILAGTVGAVCFPLMVGLWNRYRKASVLGIISCLVIVFCSSSSGPLVSLFAGIGGLGMWYFRNSMRFVRWMAIIGYIGLEMVMKAPAYYLMGRIPLVPGSTGWHRAELINSAIRHLNEWWIWGTEYTRHWMPTGVSWSPDHTDITNHYIKMGVIGGLPLMLLFILILIKAFSYIGNALKITDDNSVDIKFMIWALGSSLFANAATMISVSYFDQSFIFLYLNLAIAGSIYSISKNDKS